jgi:hypothetical protein
LNDYEVDQNDRPLYPPKIINTEILYNPFDDIVPRTLPSKKEEPKKEKKTKETTKGIKYENKNMFILYHSQSLTFLSRRFHFFSSQSYSISERFNEMNS